MAIQYTSKVMVIDYKVPVNLTEANTAVEFYDLGDDDKVVGNLRKVASGFFDDPTDDMADYFQRCIDSGAISPQLILVLALAGFKDLIMVEGMGRRGK